MVKCTLVQALRLRAAHRGSRGIALIFLDHNTRRWWGVSVMSRPLFTPRKDPVPIVQEAGWAPGPVWTGAENLAPTGIWSLDRPAHSQSLYQLRYPSHCILPEYSQHCKSIKCHKNLLQVLLICIWSPILISSFEYNVAKTEGKNTAVLSIQNCETRPS